MEFKHFSHNHALVFHQMPQGSEIHCSGCKSPGSGNVYVCWQCGHFLHDECYRATRSLKHPSHPLHPLTLVPYPTYPSGSFFCNSCNLVGNGLSYTCSECQFDMHVHCALLPNHIPNDAHNYSPHQTPIYPPPYNTNTPNFSPHPQNTTYPPTQNHVFPNIHVQNDIFPSLYPQPNYSHPTSGPYMDPPIRPNTTIPTDPPPPPPYYPTVQPPNANNFEQKPPSIIKHFSHPHILKEIELEQKNGKICSACECNLSGSAFCCIEPHCSFNLHKACFDAPLEVRHKSHLSHPLKLVTAPPYSDGFTCNACLKEGKSFAYTCATCSYDLHIDCVSWPEKVTRPDHEHTLTLYYSSPAAQTSQEITFMCDVCENPVHELSWIYYCRECDFGTHLDCVASGIEQENVTSSGASEAELIALQILFAALGRKPASDAI